MDDGLDQETHGMYRLAQVVTGGGQKLVFIEQGLFRFLFGLAELLRKARALLFETGLLNKKLMRTQCVAVDGEPIKQVEHQHNEHDVV